MFKPRIYHIEPSAYCQAYCSRCPRRPNHNSIVKEKSSNISLKDFNELILPWIDQNCEVLFCGNYGDPMMNKEMADIAISAMSATNNVVVNTNGGIGTCESYTKMAQAGVTILFDVEGTTQETHQKYRRGVSWDKLHKNIEAAANGYKGNINRLMFYVLAWKHTIDDLYNIYKLAETYDACIKLEQPRGATHTSSLAIVDKTQTKIIDIVDVYDDYNTYPYGHYCNSTHDRSNKSKKLKDILEIKPETVTSNKIVNNNRVIPIDDPDLTANNVFIDTDKELNVDCPSLSDQSVYITHSLYLLPCCWLGVKVSGYIDAGIVSQTSLPAVSNFLKLNGDKLFNLRNNNIETILNLPEFKEYTYNYLKGFNVCSYCYETCGKTRMRLGKAK